MHLYSVYRFLVIMNKRKQLHLSGPVCCCCYCSSSPHIITEEHVITRTEDTNDVWCDTACGFNLSLPAPLEVCRPTYIICYILVHCSHTLVKCWQREIRAVQRVSHTDIVRVFAFDVCDNPDPAYEEFIGIIVPYCESGDASSCA